MIYLPNGYFLLEPHQGPYHSLAAVYGACLVGWVIIAAGWHAGAFYLYKDSSVILCRAVSTLPLVKICVLAIGTSFWATCESWMMCSFWIGVLLLNTHLVYETGIVVCFLLIAKGWSITRDNLPANEWRGVIFAVCSFYLSTSIVLVLDSSVLTTQGFWIACSLLYGSMYIYIVRSALNELYLMKHQVDLLDTASDVPEAIGGPLRGKYCMYICFLALVLCNLVMEIVLHALLNKYGRMWIVLSVYEISDLVICGLVFFLFRPRDFSPFFFMVPATLNDNRTRPIPIIEASDDTKESAEIEIAPLLRSHNQSVGRDNNNDKMVVVRNPGGEVMVGMSPMMQTRHHHGGRGSRPQQRGYVPSSRVPPSEEELFGNRLVRGIESLPPPEEQPFSSVQMTSMSHPDETSF